MAFSPVLGMWRSLVAHLTGGQGVAGSNPVVPTTSKPHKIRHAFDVPPAVGAAVRGRKPPVDTPSRRYSARRQPVAPNASSQGFAMLDPRNMKPIGTRCASGQKQVNVLTDKRTPDGPDGGILVDVSTLRCGKHDPGSKQSCRGRDRIGVRGVGEAGAKLTPVSTPNSTRTARGWSARRSSRTACGIWSTACSFYASNLSQR